MVQPKMIWFFYHCLKIKGIRVSLSLNTNWTFGCFEEVIHSLLRKALNISDTCFLSPLLQLKIIIFLGHCSSLTIFSSTLSFSYLNAICFHCFFFCMVGMKRLVSLFLKVKPYHLIRCHITMNMPIFHN